MKLATDTVRIPTHMTERARVRDYYNPLRGLDMPRLVRLLEAGERGEYGDLQWLYRMVEKRDSTLRGLKMRRTSALKKLDWDIKVPDELPPGATPEMAEAQAAYLRTLYDSIENLPEVFEFLAGASFRGFAHLEKRWQHNNPALPLTRLVPVPQWHWVRNPHSWAWVYDRDAQSNWSGGVAIDTSDFVIREIDDPINEIAAICFLRKNMSQKDWDAFVEDFGIPSVFGILGEGTPEDKAEEWLKIMERVTGNSRGALPPGSDVKTVAHGSQGETPFKQHKDEQREELVLAGTGGLLAMLTAPTGLGDGQANAHDAAFDEIAQAEGAAISALLQAQVDKAQLALEFPGQPALAYFELAAVSQEDRAALGSLVAQLSQAGFEPDAAEMSEKLGMKLQKRTQEPGFRSQGPGTAGAGFYNRAVEAGNAERFFAAASSRAGAGIRSALAPLHERVGALVDIDDEAEFTAALDKLRADLPGLEKQCLGNGATAELENAFSEIIGAALADGIARSAENTGLAEIDFKPPVPAIRHQPSTRPRKRAADAS